MRPGDNGCEGPGAGAGTQRGLIMLFPFVQFTDGAIAGTEHSPHCGAEQRMHALALRKPEACEFPVFEGPYISV